MKASLFLLCFSMLALPTNALTIFSARVAGVDAWSWGGAKVKQQPQGLLIKEYNRGGNYGDAYLSDSLPWLPDGTIKLTIKPVKGLYTVQLICF